MAIIKDESLLNEDGSVPSKLLNVCIQDHLKIVNERYDILNNYYLGKHDILNRQFANIYASNNKLVVNHAKYITDMAVGYVFGQAISYNNLYDKINDLFVNIDEDSHNTELASDLSIYGVGNELVYMDNEDVPMPQLAVLSPLSSFLVIDNTVAQKSLFGVSYTEIRDINNTLKGYNIVVYLKDKTQTYFTSSLSNETYELKDEKTHYFGNIPLIEYKNNKLSEGDFECVISLIDAYNLLQSDRVNDKEQLVNSLLVVIGQSLGDTLDEQSKTVNLLNEMRVLNIGGEKADAKYLTKQLTESEVEVLKKAIKDDIHTISKVPNLTDENFVGNSSGIAMKYKLLGFEQLGKTKERYFKRGLKQRLKLIYQIESIKANNVNVWDVDIKMQRSLPVDNSEKLKELIDTDGILSLETRLRTYDAELDVEAEIERLNKEKEENISMNQKAFGYSEDSSFNKTNKEDTQDDNLDIEDDKTKDTTTVTK